MILSMNTKIQLNELLDPYSLLKSSNSVVSFELFYAINLYY